MERGNLTNPNYSLVNLMKCFIEKETGMKISKNAPRADVIKCLLVQELGLSKDTIKPKSQRPQVIYEHYTTEFTIKYGDYEVDIVTAEDNSGFLIMKTQLMVDHKNSFKLRPIYQPAPPKDYFKSLIKLLDEISGRRKLIDFKFIPEEYQKYYTRNDSFVFKEYHVWEGNEQTAMQIVEDLHHQIFDSPIRERHFFEAKYNDEYGSAKLKLYTWDQMRKQTQHDK